MAKKITRVQYESTDGKFYDTRKEAELADKYDLFHKLVQEHTYQAEFSEDAFIKAITDNRATASMMCGLFMHLQSLSMQKGPES